MSMHFGARIADLANLIVAKGANFVLTALIFWLVSRGMDASRFAEFGYWWSISTMIGGALLGGLASGLIRVVSVRGSIAHLKNVGGAAIGIATGLVALLAGAGAWSGGSGDIYLLGAATAFGILMQLQATILALLRALVASRMNALASLVLVVSIPALLWVTLNVHRDLVWVFWSLVVIFGCASLAAVYVARNTLRRLVRIVPGISNPDRLFLSSVLSFTAINVFSYAALNIDFTIVKWTRSSADFAVVAAAKIFFERFVLPFLLIIAGAFSLSVLRHGQAAPSSKDAVVRFKWNFRFMHAAFAVVSCLAAIIGYFLFVCFVRKDQAILPAVDVVCLAAGYLFYAANAVLLDALVVRRGFATVAGHVAGFLVGCAALQYTAIRMFGVTGWAAGWLAFNVLVFSILFSEGVIVEHGRPD